MIIPIKIVKKMEKVNELMTEIDKWIYDNLDAIDGSKYVSTSMSYCPNCGIRMGESHNKEGYIDEHGYYHLSHDIYERLRRGEPVPPISPKK